MLNHVSTLIFLKIDWKMKKLQMKKKLLENTGCGLTVSIK